MSKEYTPGLLSLTVYVDVLNCIQSDISITCNSATKKWDATKQLAIVPALFRGKLLDYNVNLDAVSKSSIAILKSALTQRAGLKKDSLAAAKTFIERNQEKNC